MMNFFLKQGKVKEQELAYFLEHSYAPDILGINHYITSERYLDENRERYPAWSHASNGKHRYADVEVVRADISKRAGHYTLLKEAADRYKLPIALTEVHLGATREEQLRWFMEAWDAVNALKRDGVDVRGITAWSILGAYDWNTLLTQENNFYESGVFDVRSGQPRPTALAWLIKQLAKGEASDHPVLVFKIALIRQFFSAMAFSQVFCLHQPGGRYNFFYGLHGHDGCLALVKKRC